MLLWFSWNSYSVGRFVLWKLKQTPVLSWYNHTFHSWVIMLWSFSISDNRFIVVEANIPHVFSVTKYIFSWNNSSLLDTLHLNTKEGEKRGKRKIWSPDNIQSIKIHSSNNSIDLLMTFNQKALFPFVSLRAGRVEVLLRTTRKNRTICIYTHLCFHSHFHAPSHRQTFMCRHCRRSSSPASINGIILANLQGK